MNSLDTNHPVTLTFVSGKGGVGKTMLAVAAANELSHAQTTLVLDLDFFNRGLSGMFIQGDDVEQVEPPPFIDDTDETAWWAKRVAKNLYTISFPDVTSFETKSLEPRSLDELAQALKTWIEYLCEKLNCKAVVIDCHGGPDALSFAAVKVADKSLIISEPDRVTMYGTFHFLRTLSKLNIASGSLHLVFNKIVDAVGPMFLSRLYNTHLADYFDGKPLLAAFPLELYLTKSFENAPLITEDYPQSMLARKTQVMLGDLLSDDTRLEISERTKQLPSWLKYYTRLFFGRPPKFLSLSFLAAVGFGLLLIVVGVQALSSLYSDERRMLLDDLAPRDKFGIMMGELLVTDYLDETQSEQWTKLSKRIETISSALDSLQKVIVVWAACASMALVISWTNYLDRQVTMFFGRRRFGWAGGVLSCQMLLWAAISIFLSAMAYDLVGRLSAELEKEVVFYSAILFSVMGMALGIAIWHIFRGYQEVSYSSQKIMGLGRVFFGVAVMCGVMLGGLFGF